MSLIREVNITDATSGDTANIVAANGSNGLVVLSPGHISTANSTATPLAAAGVFTGTYEDITNFGVIMLIVYSSHDSATDGLEVQFSTDGVNIDSVDNYTVEGGTGKTFSFQAAAKYFRVMYTNGGTLQTEFRLQTIIKPYYVKPSSHRISDSIVGDDDAELVKAILSGKNPAGDFVNFTSTTSGNFKMSLEELENAISVNSNSQLRVTNYLADGNQGNMLVGTNYISGYSGIDASTEAIETIQYEHHEIHSGSHYEITDYVDLAINNVFDIQFTTPNTTAWSHIIFTFDCESETLWHVYEAATINTPGTSVTPINNNRNSVNTSGNTVAAITNTSVANAEADTDTSGATVISQGIAGSGRSGGNVMRSRELMLKQNTVYCLRAVASAAGFISYSLQWYEHTDKN